MRIVGRRRWLDAVLRGPTEDEIRASVEQARSAPRILPKGVYRYRSHEEAQADMDRWIAEAIARRQRELDG